MDTLLIFFSQNKTVFRNLVRCLRKGLLSIISASFSKLNDFIINFVAKEVALDTFVCPESTFSRNITNLVFSFSLWSSKGKRGICGNFYFFSHLWRFLSNLRTHWRLSTILKTSNKSMWSNVFWYAKVCIFWKCI